MIVRNFHIQLFALGLPKFISFTDLSPRSTDLFEYGIGGNDSYCITRLTIVCVIPHAKAFVIVTEMYHKNKSLFISYNTYSAGFDKLFWSEI